MTPSELFKLDITAASLASDREARERQASLAPAHGSAHVIEGKRLTVLISNAHRLLKARYRKSPLWSLVADLTGNGSTTSVEICRAAGYDPSQPCGAKYLKASAPNSGVGE